MASVPAPRGMRDFLPAEKARRERVLSIIRERYRAHGFDEIETPVVEDYDRLHSGLGGDNEKLSYSILRRGLDADAIRAGADSPSALSDLGLRFDLTVPLARFYATNRGSLPPVFRALQIAPVWRAERPQKGRYRQFMQTDIDIVGDASSCAEVELLLATTDTLDALGLAGVTIRLNDRRLLDAMLAHFGFDERDRPSVLITVDKLDKVGADGVVAELREKGLPGAAVDAVQAFFARGTSGDAVLSADVIRAALPAGIASSAIDELAAIAESVDGALGPGAPRIRFDPFLVRGMGYYTGTIFEVAHPDVTYALGGGGRYDTMVGRFLGQDVPAVGFSLGFERIVDLVTTDNLGGADGIVLIHDRDVDAAQLASVKQSFIADGVRTRLEQRTKNVRAILDRASTDGYASFAFVPAGATRETLEVKPLGAQA